MKAALIVTAMIATGAVGALAIEPVLPDGARTWIDARQQSINRVDITVADVPAVSDSIATLTLKAIGPKTELDCIITGCESGPLDERTTGVMTFTVEVAPGTALAEVPYSVYLIGLDGFIHSETTVRWTEKELAGVDPTERSRSKIREVETLARRTVKLAVSYDDNSILGFIKDYNERFEAGLAKYSVKIVDECGLQIEGARTIVGNPECLDRVIEQYELADLEIGEIVANNFHIGIMRGIAFYERRDPDKRGYLTGF